MIVEILNKVKKLYTAFNTNDRITKLDALGLPTGHIVPDGNDWNSTRAGYLTTINGKMPSGTIASTTEVAKVSDGYTAALATSLSTLKKIPGHKVVPAGAGGHLVDNGLMNMNDQSSMWTHHVPVRDSSRGILADGQLGYRHATLALSSSVNVDDQYYDVVPPVSGGGYIYAITFGESGSQNTTLTLQLIVDGITVYESGKTSLNTAYGYIVFGIPYYASTYYQAHLSPIPIRFNTGFSLKLKHSDVTYGGCAAITYLLD